MDRRRPVWNVLSDFFLDTEFDAASLARVRETLLKSGYSLDEIRNIFFDEVAPAVGSNFFSVAGEWAGFDEEWLEKTIVEETQGAPPGQASAVFRRVAFLHAWQDVRRAYEGKPDFYPKWRETFAFYLFFICHPYGFFMFLFGSFLLWMGVMEIIKYFRS